MRIYELNLLNFDQKLSIKRNRITLIIVLEELNEVYLQFIPAKRIQSN